MSKAEIMPDQKPAARAALKRRTQKTWKEFLADKSIQHWILFIIGSIFVIGLAILLFPSHANTQPKMSQREAPIHASDTNIIGDGEYGDGTQF